ncbi:MAG TPA: superoxide dismutase [Bacteroidia bacterium]|jgi:Fe-Mn family superoxide dismutase|nr:superoxide dismutase [Bacteroidia bacterium]
MDKRRDFLKKSFLATLGISFFGKKLLNAENHNALNISLLQINAPYTLPDLPYAYDAIEPHIDMQTMQIHHDKHHQAYVTNLNKALADVKDAPADLESLLKTVSKMPVAVRNNGGGHWNHTFFWNSMRATASAGSSSVPNGKLAEAINSTFTSFDKFKEQFANAGKDRFGSGWAWLIVDKDKKLQIISTPNQDNPLMDIADTKGVPVLGLDVWEHAYYLKYQNKRADYVTAWWNVVNWEKAAELYENAVK